LRVNRYRSLAAEPDAKSALTQKPTRFKYPLRWRSACCARSTAGDPAASFDYLVRQNEPSFTLALVQSGTVPKTIEFFIRVEDVAAGGYTADRATVRQKRTGRPVRFELSEQTRQAVDDYLKATGKRPGDCSQAVAVPETA
jgi:hypothetical protein